MKKHYILSTLVASVAALSLSQAIASGMTYDPYENYYNNFYGTASYSSASESSNSLVADKQVQKNKVVSKAAPTQSELYMADPLNFYNW